MGCGSSKQSRADDTSVSCPQKRVCDIPRPTASVCNTKGPPVVEHTVYHKVAHDASDIPRPSAPVCTVKEPLVKEHALYHEVVHDGSTGPRHTVVHVCDEVPPSVSEPANSMATPRSYSCLLYSMPDFETDEEADAWIAQKELDLSPRPGRGGLLQKNVQQQKKLDGDRDITMVQGVVHDTLQRLLTQVIHHFALCKPELHLSSEEIKENVDGDVAIVRGVVHDTRQCLLKENVDGDIAIVRGVVQDTLQCLLTQVMHRFALCKKEMDLTPPAIHKDVDSDIAIVRTAVEETLAMLLSSL